mgnify:FL=1
MGAEAALVRGAIGMMVDSHVAETDGVAEPCAYGIDWFDQWDAPQRLWLIEQVTSAFLGNTRIESQAAIIDAAADAIFFEVSDLVRIEIEQGLVSSSGRSWRQSVIDAFATQNDRPPDIDAICRDIHSWRLTITQIADSVLGIRLYQRAENFRDADYVKTRIFLRDRGLPNDYLSRIPPLRSTEETQQSIDCIQRFVFEE